MAVYTKVKNIVQMSKEQQDQEGFEFIMKYTERENCIIWLVGSRLLLIFVYLFAGTVCDFRLSYGRVLSRRSKVIAVNRDKSQLLKNSDMFWKPTIAIQGNLLSQLCFHYSNALLFNIKTGLLTR